MLIDMPCKWTLSLMSMIQKRYLVVQRYSIPDGTVLLRPTPGSRTMHSELIRQVKYQETTGLNIISGGRLATDRLGIFTDFQIILHRVNTVGAYYLHGR